MEMKRMNSSAVFSALRQFAALFLSGIMIPAAWAQANTSMPNAPAPQGQKAMPSSSQPFDLNQYSKPVSQFPNVLAPYRARTVAPPNLANTARIDQLMRNG